MATLTTYELEHFNETKRSAIIGSLVLLLVLSNFCVVVRLAAQLRAYRRLFAEDHLIVFAVVSIPSSTIHAQE